MRNETGCIAGDGERTAGGEMKQGLRRNEGEAGGAVLLRWAVMKLDVHSFLGRLWMTGLSAIALVIAGCDDGSSSSGSSEGGYCEGCCLGDGCSDPPPEPPSAQCIDLAPPDPAAIAVLVGTSDNGAFTELSSGQPMSIVVGGQGGQHVWVTLRVFTNATGTFIYRARFNDVAGIQSAFEGCAATQWAELIDVPVFLDTDNPGPSTLKVEISPQGGDVAVAYTMNVELQ
ncbi:MAG: hypothetical protein IPK82_07360 [Polyangiaceae bacterium]|nr:hypothetical protein [Polyangiaceae bacterium]